MQVHKSPETLFLDKGNGTCINFDTTQRRCSIYETRPDICRVDRQYFLRFYQQCTWDEFVEINLRACQKILELHEMIGKNEIS